MGLSRPRRLAGLPAGPAGLIAGLSVSVGCTGAREVLGRAAIDVMEPSYAPDGDPEDLRPLFTGPDAERRRIGVSLVAVTRDVVQPTDVQFRCAGPPRGAPCTDELMFVVEKAGVVRWFDARGASGTWLETEVVTVAEQGLLGLVFHPAFEDNGRLFVNRTVEGGGPARSQVVELGVAAPERTDLRTARPVEVRVVLEVEQPYQNHNAGQLAFGPDGMLYVGWGDGGLRDDPDGEGQNAAGWLGSMLRIDVDHGEPYQVPADNPQLPGWAPGTWAIGLRNPWRYSFAPDGRLIVADVGQRRWEELHVVGRGDNLGWSILEGSHCFAPAEGCDRTGLVLPVWEYGRDEGSSITGGYVARGARVPALRGRYVFGDFVSGRLWALDLPAGGERATEVAALGKWPILPSTFGIDLAGDLVVADFAGTIYRLAPGGEAGGSAADLR